jgi:hypothetical protein
MFPLIRRLADHRLYDTGTGRNTRLDGIIGLPTQLDIEAIGKSGGHEPTGWSSVQPAG